MRPEYFEVIPCRGRTRDAVCWFMPERLQPTPRNVLFCPFQMMAMTIDGYMVRFMPSSTPHFFYSALRAHLSFKVETTFRARIKIKIVNRIDGLQEVLVNACFQRHWTHRCPSVTRLELRTQIFSWVVEQLWYTTPLSMRLCGEMVCLLIAALVRTQKRIIQSVGIECGLVTPRTFLVQDPEHGRPLQSTAHLAKLEV